MCLVSSRRKGMLTQGPPPDVKCKLNVSSFLTFPHLLCHFYQEFCIYCIVIMNDWGME